MKLIKNPERSTWPELLKRPALDTSSLDAIVQQVLDEVRTKGDEALFAYTQKFDGVQLQNLVVTEGEIAAGIEKVSVELKAAIQQAAENIRKFHQPQVAAIEKIETMPGVSCWRKSVGIEKVGLYIPGGSAPLFSTVLMLAIPAKLAGCKEIILCTPPSKNGSIHPAILFAASVAGVTRIFKTGGAQAIAAMAFGTDSVPQVSKICGPGNQYVTCAKQLVQRYGVAIDMPAGPSEVCVLADDTADAAFIASDLLSQAEHGPDSQVLLVTTSAAMATSVVTETARQLELLPRKELAALALENSKVVLLNDMDTAMEMVNAYAPEHLIISCANDEALGEQVVNAGSVFLGNYSPESAGDYASGTNHTLPTNGYAQAYSGVSVDSFVKKITYQKLTKNGIEGLAPTIITMAEAEGLQAHANAVTVRINKLRS